MTCVVAVECPEGVWLGCDSRVTVDDAPETRDTWARTKFFARGELLIGFAGKIGPCQVVQHIATWRGPKRGEDPEAWLVRAVAPAIRTACHANDMLDADGNLRADFLLCYRGRVWTLAMDHSLVTSQYGYAAIGSGFPWAQGSLCSTEGEPARQRLHKALKAAARHGAGVAGPFPDRLAPWNQTPRPSSKT